MSEFVKIGTVRFGSKVRVTDPCYDTDVWCSGQLSVLPGNYDCYVRRDGYGCVKALRVCHASKSIPDAAYRHPADFEVGVDSGQAGVFSLPYYKENQKRDEWYQRVCEITLSDAGCGTIDGKGFVSSSGYDDGGYDALLALDDDDKTVIGINITFIYDDGEEE